MECDFTAAEAVISAALDRVFPAAQIEVRQRGEVLWSAAYGWLDPESRTQPTGIDTLFDLASVTKLFVVTAFMTLVEEGIVDLDQPVATVLPEFSGQRPIRPYDDPLRPGATVAVAWEGAQPTAVDAGRVTFRHLLTHTSGLPAWRPLYKDGSADAARRVALTTTFSYPTGARIIYSDIGLILIGMAIESLTGQPLDEAVYRRVTGLLGLTDTHYLPLGKSANQQISNAAISDTQYATRNTAPTEFCTWRQRRVIGEVHDENAAGLGGVAGHAGLFSTAHDLAVFGQSFLRISESTNQRIDQPDNASRITSHVSRTAPVLPTTIAEMTRLQAHDGTTRRGLGFMLWSPDPEASGNPFSQRAFGHTGFTGTSLWIDPARDRVVACCTNRVYTGRDAASILEFRVALHRAIVEGLDE
jgi:CubicO group peptidase (beta-lactamase class C family)